jgi:hypothetical protein
MSIPGVSRVVLMKGAETAPGFLREKEQFMTAPAITATRGETASKPKLTAQELDQARKFLEQTQNAVVGATKGLSEMQWRFKPSPDQWSIAENLDHVVTVLERVLGPILDQLADAPAPAPERDFQQIDRIVINQFPNRLLKFQAPEFVRPADQIDPHELLNRLTADYARLAECLESRPALREHVAPAAPLKAVSQGAFELMDGYQWILAAAAHTERHTKQMLEVMAEPSYPA